MPKGKPKPQTVASEKYQKKAGYMTKGFKLKRDSVEEFENACDKAGVSQASQITLMMKEFSRNLEEKYAVSHDSVETLLCVCNASIAQMKEIQKQTEDKEIKKKADECLNILFNIREQIMKYNELHYELYNAIYKNMK